MKMLGLIAVMALTLFLASCSQVPVAVEKVKDVADKAARLEVQLPCAMTVGAYYRVMSDRQKLGVTLLCDPNSEKPEKE